MKKWRLILLAVGILALLVLLMGGCTVTPEGRYCLDREQAGEWAEQAVLPTYLLAEVVKRTGLPRLVADLAATQLEMLMQAGFTREESLEIIILTIRNLLESVR